jgi:hypothetical protein
MPVDMRTTPSGREIASARGLFGRILDWIAVVVAIGLYWWAAAVLL